MTASLPSGARSATLRLPSVAAAACGADGLIIEVHNDPQNAACDGAQSLTPEQFADLADGVRKIREVIGNI